VNTLLDVLRAVVDGLLRVGGIGQEVHAAAHEVINAHDTDYQDAQRKAAEFSDSDRAELERLQAKAAAAERPAEPEPAAPTSPLLTGGGAE
jgi:hypothetical protein